MPEDIGPGHKFDDGKPKVDLVDPEFIYDVAIAAEYGAKKYAPWNWLGGFAYMRCFASIMRHLLEWARGRDVDEESGLPHLSMAAAQLMFLMHQVRRPEQYGHLDDRPKFEDVEIKKEDDRW